MEKKTYHLPQTTLGCQKMYLNSKGKCPLSSNPPPLSPLRKEKK